MESISTKTTLLSGIDESSLETIVKQTNYLFKREAKLLDEEHVLTSESAVADSGVISARNNDCTSIKELADRVILDAFDGFGVNIAGWARLNNDR